MRSRILYAAAAVCLLNGVSPAQAESAPLDRTRVITLVKHVINSGTWEQQRATFERLPEPERSAVWAALIDVRPTEVRLEPVDGPDGVAGPCRDQEIDQCDYAAAPRPRPGASPGTNPSRPPLLTPPVTDCVSQPSYIGYEILGEPGMYAFKYAARLHWCYRTASVTGPLTEYSSYSWAYQCCVFPWTTDPSKYVDRLTAVPAANTLNLFDPHTGWFQAEATAGPISGGLTHTPNIDGSVAPDGTYTCSG